MSWIFFAGLLISYVSVWINPGSFWLPALFGLFFPYILIINLLFLGYWIYLKKKAALVFGLVVILGWGHVRNNFQLLKKEPPESLNSGGPQSISIMTYNVRLFDFYHSAYPVETRANITGFIKKLGKNIICLQEILTQDTPQYNEQTLRDAFNMHPYVYLKFSPSVKQTTHYGIGIFSSFPIIHRGEITFENTFNLCIFADIKVGNDTIRVYNSHLQSFQLGSGNFKFLTEFENTFEDETLDELQDLTSRMKKAYIKRAEQARKVSGHILDSPYPVIVCGDFNDTPVSYTYHRIRDGLKDAFVESGYGLGNTYAQIKPSYRIDFILHSQNFRSYDFKVHDRDYSDHYPISTLMEFSSE